MLVDTRELDVGFVRVGNDETVDETLADSVGDEMAQEVLNLNRGSSGWCMGWTLGDVVEDEFTELVERNRGGVCEFSSPAVDETFKLRGSILFVEVQLRSSVVRKSTDSREWRSRRLKNLLLGWWYV